LNSSVRGTDKDNVLNLDKYKFGPVPALGRALALPMTVVLGLELLMPVVLGFGVFDVVLDVLDVSPAPSLPPAVRGTSVGGLIASLAF
jgi:hypothetical protein